MAFFFDPAMLEDSDDFDAMDGILWQSQSFSIEPLHRSQPKVPTHTEDGIPIRKLYVSNLPPQTTRTELFEFFVQYGYIKSCWVKHADQNIRPYAFVTYIDPEDAHKALKASRGKCYMRGKLLRIMPADSWHQPQSDADGNVIWSNKKPIVVDDQPENTSTAGEQSGNTQEAQGTSEAEYNILDLLNHDCLSHVMSYVPIQDLIRSEAVSKRWRAMVHDYFLSLRTFKTSSWRKGHLTTAKLRQLLQRMGPTLTSLHVDEHGYSLNDRTARTVGKFCPCLERLTIDGMNTKYWNPVAYSCKNLKTISFTACSEIDDASLTSLLSLESSIENLHLSGIELISGRFLESTVPKINSLTLHRCPNLVGKHLKTALPKMTHLRILNLNKVRAWPAMPALAGLTQLEELYLCNLYGNEQKTDLATLCQDLVEALGKLSELKVLALSKNQHLDNRVLEQIANSCTKLRKLDIMGCGEDDEQLYSASALVAIATKCTELQHINVSYNANLDKVIPALVACRELRSLVARGSSTLTDQALSQCILACHQLELVDVCDCKVVTEAVITSCVAELERRPRHMKLYLGGTDASPNNSDIQQHPMLTVDFECQRCFTNLLVGTIIQDMSDDSDYDYDHYNDLFSDPDFDNSDPSYLDEYDEDEWDEVMELHPDFLHELNIF